MIPLVFSHQGEPTDREDWRSRDELHRELPTVHDQRRVGRGSPSSAQWRLDGVDITDAIPRSITLLGEVPRASFA